MVLNLYVMPVVTVTIKGSPSLQPKYLSTYSAFGGGVYTYGNEPWCLVGVADIDAATDTALKANPDVIALPANLDAAVGAGPLATVRNNLESVNIPGTWVQVTNTWRDVVRFVGACCQFAGRYQGGACGGVWFTGGVTLASTFGTLPANVQQCLLDAATSFGFDASGLTAATTMRAILRNVGVQYLATQPALILAGVPL